jgi:TDG/mug DNA glycosylase family protein
MTPRLRGQKAFPTLPDYLRRNLDLVLIGINPGLYSVERGHYFARSTSRFWPAFSASKLSEPIRQCLGIDKLLPAQDHILLRFGIGLTDVVKRASANAADLSEQDFRIWAPILIDKLKRYRPRVACFHGLTAYRPFLRIALGSDHRPSLGAQPHAIGRTKIFVVPNPSPANAHFTPADQASWYDKLNDFVLLTKQISK